MSNLPATQGQPAKPAANKVLDLIASPKAKAQFAMALPKHITAELMARICLTAINKVPKLAECTQETLFGCIMDLAQMGLVPDNRNAYLIPRWSNKKKVMECTYIVGYQGFIELAYRHPLVKGIRFNAVHKNDFFDYEDGLESRLVHRPTDAEDTGPLIHAWAVCELQGGGRTFVVIGQREIRTAMKMQPDSDKPYSPWQVHPDAMWQKTAVRALAKRMPRSAELMAAIEADDRQANLAAFDLPQIGAGNIGALPGSDPLTDATGAGDGGGDAGQGGSGGGSLPIDVDSTTTRGGSGGGGPTLEENRKWINAKLSEMNIGKTRFVKALEESEIIARVVPFDEVPNEALQAVVDSWDDFKTKLLPK